NVAGLGQALDQFSDAMPFIQGRNEQALVHAATAFAKHSRRHATLAVTSSIGPGALNMVTGAALATVNRLPVLLLPGDTYATRRQGQVLQQLEHPTGGDVTVNDCFRPVARFFDRITRPEQLLTALPEAMRVLTSPTEAGAVVIALPQDIQSEAHDFPAAFFAPREWTIARPAPHPDEVASVAKLIAEAEQPLLIAGGGVLYSEADAELAALDAQTSEPQQREAWGGRARTAKLQWLPVRAEALRPSGADPISQGELIGVLNESARPGDTIIAAAGGPPGDLNKVWDATGERHCHLEFGFSCMGYELPATLGVRLAQPEGEVIALIGDGTVLMQPSE